VYLYIKHRSMILAVWKFKWAEFFESSVCQYSKGCYKKLVIKGSDGSGLKYFDLGRVNFCGSGRVSHLWFPLKILNISIFFASGQKKFLGPGQ